MSTILIGSEVKDAENLSKKDHEHVSLEALWEAQAILSLLDRKLDGGTETDLGAEAQEEAGHAVRAALRRLNDASTHAAESW